MCSTPYDAILCSPCSWAAVGTPAEGGQSSWEQSGPGWAVLSTLALPCCARPQAPAQGGPALAEPAAAEEEEEARPPPASPATTGAAPLLQRL